MIQLLAAWLDSALGQLVLYLFGLVFGGPPA